MDEFIGGWVAELSPIHETAAHFERGGPECGMAILRLYQGLLEAEQNCGELQDEIENLQDEADELREEIAELKKEIADAKR